MHNPLQKAFKIFLNTLYPPNCLLCRDKLQADAPALCPKCWMSFDLITEACCNFCGALSDACSCPKKHEYIDKFLVAMQYNNSAMRIISKFKYNNCKKVAPVLGQILYTRIKHYINEVDVWLPVPLHSKRIKERGYNQAAILTHFINKASQNQMLCKYDILTRQINNKQQAKLSKSARLLNVKNIFVLNDRHKSIIQNKTVGIIDDVITTGATIQECARTLKNGGANKVYGISIART